MERRLTGWSVLALSRPMQRRSGQEARRMVLSAAEKVIQKDGIDALSIRDLAARTGYSPSALYKHFASKDDVIAALKEAFLERLLERMRFAVERHDDPADCLHAELTAFIEQALEQPNHFLEAFCNPARAATATEAGPAAMGILHDTIRGGIGAGVFAERDVEAAALHVWASVHGLAVIMACHPKKWADRGKTIDDHVRFAVAALKQPSNR